jgi:hypothetical protein
MTIEFNDQELSYILPVLQKELDDLKTGACFLPWYTPVRKLYDYLYNIHTGTDKINILGIKDR